MMKSGREEAARTVEVAYRLFDSLYTQRVMKLTMLTEAFKYEGLNHSEASRIRQYERFLGECIEDLRVIKTYRTPQALRAFGRIFTVCLPPFYAPSFAQLAFDLDSLAMGILMSIITPLCLTALFESIQVLEDPFVGYITLDGIDVREEFQVLRTFLHYQLSYLLITCIDLHLPHSYHTAVPRFYSHTFIQTLHIIFLRCIDWQQLVNARRIIFPYAPPFPAGPQTPVMWEVVTEEIPPDDLIEDSNHSSEATPTIDNKDLDLELGDLDEMNRISLHDLETGYAPEDMTIDMRTSNFRDVLRLQSNQPSSLGASFRSVVRRRLPSVDSVRHMNASKSSRQMRRSEHSREESIPEDYPAGAKM